jgi:hypothetical protein
MATHIIEEERGVSPRRRRVLYWLALAFSILAALYCWSGVAMNASFAVASPTPAAAAGHRLAAEIFAGLTLVSLLAAAASAVALWRTRRSRPAI